MVFPARTAELTPALLTAALAELRPGVRVESLRVVEEAHCDTGSASTAAFRCSAPWSGAPDSNMAIPSPCCARALTSGRSFKPLKTAMAWSGLALARKTSPRSKRASRLLG